VKSIDKNCEAYKKLKNEKKSDPKHVKFGTEIIEDLNTKLGVGDTCGIKPKRTKRPKKGKILNLPTSTISTMLNQTMKIGGQDEPGGSGNVDNSNVEVESVDSPVGRTKRNRVKKDKGRRVIFDSSPYESTRCMNNTAFNKLEARIITEIRDLSVDKILMSKVLEIFKLECEELTPVKSGVLLSSLYTYIDYNNTNIIGVIGYNVSSVYRIQPNGRKVFYALAVHNRTAHHTNPPRATWRFLEIAFENKYIRNMAKELLK
jgi:hypothetical protein